MLKVRRIAKVMQQESDEACRSLSFDLLSGNLSTATEALDSLTKKYGESDSHTASRASTAASNQPPNASSSVDKSENELLSEEVRRGGEGTTDVRVILLRSIARRQQGRLVDSLGEVDLALKLLTAARDAAPKRSSGGVTKRSTKLNLYYTVFIFDIFLSSLTDLTRSWIHY